MSSADVEACESPLHGAHVALIGPLASMGRREFAQLLKTHDAQLVEPTDPRVALIVVGDGELPLAADSLEAILDQTLRDAVEEGRVRLVSESHLFQELGMVDAEHDARRLYTPAMLAELVKVPVAIIRRWHRRGLIVPVREVRRLPYFDFQEVATARRLAELLMAGVSAPAIEKKLAALAQYLPDVKRPLSQLSVIVHGKQLLLRQGEGLVEPGGQRCFDFDAEPAADAAVDQPPLLDADAPATPGLNWEQLEAMAGDAEDQGNWTAAADFYRAALVSGGPRATTVFRLAEVLYHLGDLGGARERYYSAIELDEDFVEARCNLGCVLVETQQLELAVAAFRGALLFHEDFPDAHFHLARTLDELHRSGEAIGHWRTFIRLAPDSPWADEARERIEAFHE